MPLSIQNITANDARLLDRLRRHYEMLLTDPFLSRNILHLNEKYNRIMQRIYILTEPLLEKNVYSIPGISRPQTSTI